MGGALVSLEIRTPTATLNIAAFCEGAMPLDRAREYGVRMGRAAESEVWGKFGDGRENPSAVQWRVILKRNLTRQQQRAAIAQIRAFCRAASSIYVIADQELTAVTWGEVTAESPTELSYTLTLTFYPASAASAVPVTPDTGVY